MDEKRTYEELEARLAEAEKIIEAIRTEQVDAIVGKKSVYLIRLKEMEEALRESKDELENRLIELQNAQERLRDANEKSEALDRINVTLHSTLDFDEIVKNIVSEGAVTLASDSAAISLQQGDGWTVKHVYGMPSTLIGTRMTNEEELHAVHAIQTREPVTVDDAFNDHRFNREHLRRHNIRSVLVAPLIFQDRPLGVIFFNYHAGPHSFTDTEVYFVRHLAATASIALEHARLFSDYRKAQEELELRVQERTAELEELYVDLKNLSRRLLEAQETERRNVALDLHDSLGGGLAGIKMAVENKLEGIRRGKGPSETVTMEEILDLVKKCMRDNSRIQHNLRPSVLDLLGLASGLRSLCREFEENRRIKTDCITGIDGVDMPEDLKIVIYRIAQEALNNVAKHSKAETVRLSLTHEKGKIQLMIKDDGCGFDMEEAMMPESNTDSIGLSSMKERCELSGGSFSIQSGKGEGTTVCANWVR
jgi:signal transduction histidine kinase